MYARNFILSSVQQSADELLQLDLLHIDDCVEAFILAISQLNKSIGSWSLRAPRTSLQVFNVASGESVPVRNVLNSILQLTRSKSPIRYISQDARFPNVYRGSTVKARTGLAFQARISVEDGLHKLVKMYLQRTHDFLSKRVKDTCGAASPSLALNARIDKLNDCDIHAEANVLGELASLSLDSKLGVWTTTSTMPPERLKSFTYLSSEGKRLMRIAKKEDEAHFLGISGIEPGPVTLKRIFMQDAKPDEGIVIDFEVDVDVESATINLAIPGTNLSLSPPTYIGGRFSIVNSDNGPKPPGAFRLTPTCCAVPLPWPFILDDRE